MLGFVSNPRPRRFRDDRCGATALEFGLIAPALIMTVLALVDVMVTLTVDLAMSSGMQDAARSGSLGTTPATGTRESAITAAIVARAAGLIDQTALTVALRTYGSGTPSDYTHRNGSSTVSTGAGSSRQVVQYSVTYVQQLLTPLAMAFQGATSVTHNSVIVVQNEPF